MNRKTEQNAAPALPSEASDAADLAQQRRAMLTKLARFAVVSAPAVTLLLAATLKPKKAAAVSF